MGSFFQGWRKKVGLATLIMALAFMGGWLRSLSIVDLVVFPSRLFPVANQYSRLRLPIAEWSGKDCGGMLVLRISVFDGNHFLTTGTRMLTIKMTIKVYIAGNAAVFSSTKGTWIGHR